MKKILALLALGLFGLASYATAGPLVAPHVVWKQLSFRTHAAATAPGAINGGVDAMGGYIDSLTKTNAAAAFDTTVAFSYLGSTAGIPVSTGLDSSLAFQVTAYDAGSTTSSGKDSLYLQVQVSPDGKLWQSLSACLGTPVALAYLANTTVNGTVIPNITVNGSTSTAKIWNWRIGRVPPVAPTAGRLQPDLWHAFEWPFVRFIFLTDDGAGIQNIAAKLTYYSSDEDLNK